MKLVDVKELEENDWSLTPGRYVGVAQDDGDDEDFGAAMEEIQTEFRVLTDESSSLSERILLNLEEMSVA